LEKLGIKGMDEIGRKDSKTGDNGRIGYNDNFVLILTE